MSRSLLLPKFFVPKFSPTTRLYLVKVCASFCLSLFALLLTLPPAQAQGLPTGWTAVPCDATGNTNGTTGFQGTQTGTLTRTGTYKHINDFITAYPDYYADGTYANAAAYYIRPTYLNADKGATVKVGSIGVGTTSDYGSQEGMQARNFDYDNSNTDGFFTAPGYNNEALSGTLATNVSAGLTVYFKCVWQGSGPQPKYPASMSLKVTTTVTTTGAVSYSKSDVTSGLMATANASDSLGDSLSASVMSPGDTSPPPLVASYIEHASIDSGTGIASAGFSGQAQMTVSNMVPYTDAPGGRGTYTDYAVANANANIAAQAVLDSRAVTISCPAVDTSQYRDPPLTGPIIVNASQSDGTMRGDTVRPYAQPVGGAGQLNFGYHANVAGAWGSSSSYLWNNQTGGPNPGNFTESGMFTLGINGVPDYTPAYRSTAWDLGGLSNFVDHIYLHLTDSSGGANATSNYYMHFHEKYEPVSWPEDAAYPRKQTTQVDPDVPGWPTYSWHAEVNPDT